MHIETCSKRVPLREDARQKSVSRAFCTAPSLSLVNGTFVPRGVGHLKVHWSENEGSVMANVLTDTGNTPRMCLYVHRKRTKR